MGHPAYMPYEVDNPPDQAKKYTPKGQRAFVHAFNDAYDQGEETAFKIAHAAAKKAQVSKIAKAIHQRGWSIERVEKHLLGRHDQDNHDPTKGGHSRKDHGTGRGAAGGALVGGALGGIAGHMSEQGRGQTARGAGIGALLGGLGGAYSAAQGGEKQAAERHQRNRAVTHQLMRQTQMQAPMQGFDPGAVRVGPSGFNPQSTRPRGKNTAYRYDRNMTGATSPVGREDKAERGVNQTRGFRGGTPFTMRS